MDLLFLGTSSGVPTNQRNVTGLALIEERGQHWHLIDCGEASQHQILRTPLSLSKLDTILITHVHGDHCYGLPGVLASAAMSGRKQPLQIIAPQGIEEWLEATCRLTQLYLPYEVHYRSAENLHDSTHGGFIIDSIELSHRVPSYAYRFTETQVERRLNTQKLDDDQIPRGPLWGKIQQGIDVEFNGQRLVSADYLFYDRRPRRLIVAGDNDTPALLTSASKDCDVLVHEATYTRDVAAHQAASYGHSTAHDIASFAEAVKLPNLILTHFSPRYQNRSDASPSINDIESEARSAYSGHLHLAADYARYQLDRQSGVQCLYHPYTDNSR
ncbi:MAG: ribonuclease Z [Wenzhouxiangellaceae bacterium]